MVGRGLKRSAWRCWPLQVWDCRRLEKDVSFRSRLTYTAQVGGWVVPAG